MRNYFVYKSTTSGKDRFMDIDAKCPNCGTDKHVILTDCIKDDSGAKVYFFCLGPPGLETIDCGHNFYINFKNKGN